MTALCFRELLSIPPAECWDVDLHGVEARTWARQAKLPLRLGGCGLRDSSALRFACYWASWADSMPDIIRRFPVAGRDMLRYLSAAQALDDDAALPGPSCLVQADLAGKVCRQQGWTDRPLWIDIVAGLRPQEPARNVISLGEWKHGWQFHASQPSTARSHEVLMRELSAPTFRNNAATVGKCRLRSCSGPFAATWMTVCPKTEGLTMNNQQLQFALRRRLGLAVCWDGPDAHGHAIIAARGAAMNARHTVMIAAWRQVFIEAGGKVPDRNRERMLRNTHIPVPPEDTRRMDLVVPGLNVARGLPLFCDATILSPVSGNGLPRASTSNADGRLLEQAQRDNDHIYEEVLSTGLGVFLCLGCEVYGRWGDQCVKLVPELARERTRGLHPRVRRGTALALQHRWWGILGMALQKSVAEMVANADAGADLVTGELEPSPDLCDLEVIA